MADDSKQFGIDDDAMILLAALVSRVEALVVASMLEAAGVFVNIGGVNHASVQINSLALGGHRLWVPKFQYEHASAVLMEVLGEDEWGFSKGLQRAVFRVVALWFGLSLTIFGVGVFAGQLPIWELLLTPLSALSVPVNPQGRGDYYLADG